MAGFWGERAMFCVSTFFKEELFVFRWGVQSCMPRVSIYKCINTYVGCKCIWMRPVCMLYRFCKNREDYDKYLCTYWCVCEEGEKTREINTERESGRECGCGCWHVHVCIHARLALNFLVNRPFSDTMHPLPNQAPKKKHPARPLHPLRHTHTPEPSISNLAKHSSVFPANSSADIWEEKQWRKRKKNLFRTFHFFYWKKRNSTDNYHQMQQRKRSAASVLIKKPVSVVHNICIFKDSTKYYIFFVHSMFCLL